MLYDQTSSGESATQSALSNGAKLCTKNECINKREFLKSDVTNKEMMISTIDLNANIVNVFVVYKMDSYDTLFKILNNRIALDNNILNNQPERIVKLD